MAKIKFTDVEKNTISEAIKKAEMQTNGEIVTCIVKNSDNYIEIPFFASAFTFILGLITINILSELWVLPAKFSILSYSLFLLGIVAITFILFMFIPFLKIGIVSEKREKKMVQLKAFETFVTNEIFNTKDRTGILIFISELERNIVILADTGINEKIEQKEWQKIVDNLALGIKKKKTAETIVNAINQCSNLLVKSGFVASKKDTNELPNNIRL